MTHGSEVPSVATQLATRIVIGSSRGTMQDIYCVVSSLSTDCDVRFQTHSIETYGASSWSMEQCRGK